MAALAYYVYPPVDDPQGDTAYRLLTRLEALEGDEARAAADSLRAELASTLVRLGDETWSKPGGEPFALDFYVQAIMFDPTIEPARTLVTMSPGELLALRRKADEGDFSEAELIAVEPLWALAQPSLADQRAQLRIIETLRRDRRRAGATAQLELLIASDPIDDEVFEPADLDGSTTRERGDTQTKRSKLREGSAEDLVAQADRARTSMRLRTAKKLYLRALRLEPERVDVLEGLGAVYFEQGKYAKAASYYERAVRGSSHDADLHIALGDAYLEMQDGDRALAQYEKAKRLGSRRAHRRIAWLEQQG
ncbi:tetratricopeptide repeat protein [Nannocystaceae bacterium ST9]